MAPEKVKEISAFSKCNEKQSVLLFLQIAQKFYLLILPTVKIDF